MKPLCPTCGTPGLADRRGNVWCAVEGIAQPMREEDRIAIENEVLANQSAPEPTTRQLRLGEGR